MSSSIDRLENLIRVLRGVAPADFDMSNWCQCAIGHASHDQYFIDEGLTISGLGNSPMAAVAEFFGIRGEQSYATFLSSGYIGPAVLGHLPASAKIPTPTDVVARLQVLLLEKRANESAPGKVARELEPVS